MQYPPYNGNPYWEALPDMNLLLTQRSRDKREIRRLGNCIGGAVLLYIALQNI